MLWLSTWVWEFGEPFKEEYVEKMIKDVHVIASIFESIVTKDWWELN